MEKEKKYLELWGDLVSLKDLIQAIILSGGLTMVGYFLAPTDNTTKQLFFGLGGAVLALIINASIIKPKRQIIKNGSQEAK